MAQYVCVRIIQGNGMDLSLFQFDYDLTFAVFFMNSDKVIYGRYGSRSQHENASQDISMEGFRKALAGALELHAAYPGNRESLLGKKGAPPRFKTPEEYPSLRNKYKPFLDIEGNVARSCIHCHQVRDADRLTLRQAAQPFPDPVLYPYPMPDVAGLSLDPKETATITHVAAGSAAEKAGLHAGDQIISMERQPILSPADVQWVLHMAGAPCSIETVVRRAGRNVPVSLPLAADWRKRSDLSWRTSTWDLRRMAAGGLLLEPVSAEEAALLQLAHSPVLLKVKHVGEYGEHAVAKQAGFFKGDLIVGVDGLARARTESEFLDYVLKTRRPGSLLPVQVRRGNEVRHLELRIQ